MDYTFNNNGLPYHFGDDSCGGGKHLPIRYNNVTAIQLQGYTPPSQQKRGFFDRLFGSTVKQSECSILITYYTSWYDKTNTSDKVVKVLPNEIEQAKTIVLYVNDYIHGLTERQQIEKAKIEQAKKTDTVDVICDDGTIEKIWKRETFFGDIVLIADGGTAYHTHADCYESWKAAYQRNFKGWKKISLRDAESSGYTPCRMCEKYYDFDDTEATDYDE